MPDPQNSLLPGSVVRVSHSGVYDHYGVYVGSSRVVHFTEGTIKETSLRDFSDYDDKKAAPRRALTMAAVIGVFALPPSEVVVDVMGFSAAARSKVSLEESASRARTMVGRKSYDVLFNNCEHFAVWCRTGVAESTQAFGSRSAHYAAAGSLSRLIQAFVPSSVGMKLSRQVLVE